MLISGLATTGKARLRHSAAVPAPLDAEMLQEDELFSEEAVRATSIYLQQQAHEPMCDAGEPASNEPGRASTDMNISCLAQIAIEYVKYGKDTSCPYSPPRVASAAIGIDLPIGMCIDLIWYVFYLIFPSLVCFLYDFPFFI